MVPLDSKLSSRIIRVNSSMTPHSIFHKAGYAFFTIAIVNIAGRMFSPEVNDGCLVKPMGDTKDWWWVKVVDAP